ncbi:MAG: hypothetical protein WC242_02525 [Candidatus Paceibacterota bacterium]|jgi:aspartate carbamoyltransferase catalytic subunit
MPKHLIKAEDFTKEDYLEVCRRAKIFQEGIEKGKDFTHLCPGKVLATLFFQESTCTSTILQSAIIRLGGGFVGISGTAGTYDASGEEDIEDFLRSYAPACDIMAVRHKSLNLDDFSADFPIPLVNAMCGSDEHTNGSLTMIYSLSRRNFDFKKSTVGFYGMTKSSRPIKAMIKMLSIMGVTMYEDPVIDEFETPPHIKDFVKKTGGQLIRGKLEDFISKVDSLIIMEGLPQPGEDPGLVEKYNKLVKIFTEKDLELVKPDAFIQYVTPRILTDGRLTVEKEVDKDSRVIVKDFLREWVYASMGLYTYLLNVKVD